MLCSYAPESKEAKPFVCSVVCRLKLYGLQDLWSRGQGLVSRVQVPKSDPVPVGESVGGKR